MKNQEWVDDSTKDQFNNLNIVFHIVFSFEKEEKIETNIVQRE